jgi:UDP-glucuronate 4-epimerase
MNILVTGGAGFIGSHLCERLLVLGHDLTVVDNFNNFYDPAVKRCNYDNMVETARRLDRTLNLCEGDIRDFPFLERVFLDASPAAVIHLAAMAGVRPSIERPRLYAEVNLDGTLNLLEASRVAGIRRFLFASSSSVYGNSPKVPFAESDPVDTPISPYAATKKGGELLCHTWHHLYGITIACLRFFTVYGPRQRPDLAIHKFARILDSGQTLPIYGDGTSSRDYTYIDDIVDGVVRALEWTGGSDPKYDIFNLGESRPVELRRLVEVLEQTMGVTAQREQLPMQAGDVERTCADLIKSSAILGYRPTTEIETGIARFVSWFREQHAPDKQCSEGDIQ